MTETRLPPKLFEYGHRLIAGLINRDEETVFKTMQQLDLEVRLATKETPEVVQAWTATLEIASLGYEMLAKDIAHEKGIKVMRRQQ